MTLGRDLAQAWDNPGVTPETRKKIPASVPSIFPDQLAPIVRVNGDGERELAHGGLDALERRTRPEERARRVRSRAGKMHVRQFLEHLCAIGGGVAVGDRNLQGDQGLARRAADRSIRMSPSRPSTAPGSISSRVSSPSSPARSCAISASHPNRNSRTASWPPSTSSTDVPSSILGRIDSITPLDMIRTSETMN